jgi:UDP-N-acetylmuramate dehydrogenase
LSCGSFFKNPIGYSAGKLIDDAWLKWTRIGWVKVSQEHWNFFINDEKAKWNDVISLRDLVKTKVFETSWVHLEEEVRIIFSREVVV